MIEYGWWEDDPIRMNSEEPLPYCEVCEDFCEPLFELNRLRVCSLCLSLCEVS